MRRAEPILLRRPASAGLLATLRAHLPCILGSRQLEGSDYARLDNEHLKFDPTGGTLLIQSFHQIISLPVLMNPTTNQQRDEKSPEEIESKTLS
jgi:hypothetical protein